MELYAVLVAMHLWWQLARRYAQATRRDVLMVFESLDEQQQSLHWMVESHPWVIPRILQVVHVLKSSSHNHLWLPLSNIQPSTQRHRLSWSRKGKMDVKCRQIKNGKRNHMGRATQISQSGRLFHRYPISARKNMWLFFPPIWPIRTRHGPYNCVSGEKQ